MSAICSLCRTNSSIPEDSLVIKTLACVPIAGIPFSLLSYSALNGKLQGINPPNRAMELVEVKMKYVICDFIRDVCSLALTIACLATGIFAASYCVPLMCCFSGAVGFHISSFISNKETLDTLQRLLSVGNFFQGLAPLEGLQIEGLQNLMA